MYKIIESFIYVLPLTILFTILIQIIIEHRLNRHRTREERQFSKFNNATEKFRSLIFTQFKGIYPFSHFSAEEINKRIRDSITEIETASIEFSYFLDNRRRRKFIKDLEQYRKAYKTIDWNNIALNDMFPSMWKFHSPNPKKVLYQHIENLLKYTDDIK